MWEITEEFTHESDYTESIPVQVQSSGFNEHRRAELTEQFQLLDGDGFVMYAGRSTDSNSEAAFAPLDDYGAPNAGCTAIQYWVEGRGWWIL